jgi:hypothetical protein
MLTSLELRVDTLNLQREGKYKTKVQKRFSRTVVLKYRGLYFVMPRGAENSSLDELGNLRHSLSISRHKLVALGMGAALSAIYKLLRR